MDKREIDRCLVKMQEGDNAAFACLYEQTKKGVYAFLYPYYRNAWNTEDAMQDVYLKIKERCLQYRPHTDGRAWMLQIAKYHALNDLEKRKREFSADSETLAALSLPERPGTGEAFDCLNRALDGTERKIVVLHVFWGYKHREIAQFLELPLGTVTSKYKISLEKLRKNWGKEDMA